MTEESSLLFSYLKRPNPTVDSTWSLTDGSTGTKRSASNGPHDGVLIRDVINWESMKWEGLKPIFGETLAFPVGNAPKFEELLAYRSHLIEIADENSLDALLISWKYPVVRTALAIAQGHTEFQNTIDRSDHPHEISMARGGQAWLPVSRLSPDWAGILFSCPDNDDRSNVGNARHYRNILPGDTKLSTKFKSKWGWKDSRFKAPINQVFTYCRRAMVPYGYIITQEELVVLHVFHGDRNDPNKMTEGGPKSYYIEYKSIPWKAEKEDDLTINLALWCLHMLVARRKPISERRGLESEYPTPAKSTQGSTAGLRSSDSHTSDGSPQDDRAEFSFVKRRRSDETESENSPDSVRRTSKRVKGKKV